MVAKNNKPIELPKIGEFDDENKVNQAVKGAALNERVKSKAGRKKKSDEEKSNEYIPVYLTTEQKRKLTQNAQGLSISMLIKSILIEKGML